jgi:hypothetical protein
LDDKQQRVTPASSRAARTRAVITPLASSANDPEAYPTSFADNAAYPQNELTLTDIAFGEGYPSGRRSPSGKPLTFAFNVACSKGSSACGHSELALF